MSEPRHPRQPLVLQEQGSFFVGGTIARLDANSTNPADDAYFLPGEIATGQMYVEYQIPAALKYQHPIVLMHGGGHTGAVYRTTPDGREGWFTSFARRGFAVYLIDAPNRGRSGWNPAATIAIARGRKPAAAPDYVNVYSAEAAWKAFRLGPQYKVPFPGQQFPTEHFGDYLRQAVPSFREPGQNGLIAEGIAGLLRRIGPSILLGWSTGAGNVMAAASADIASARAIVAVEANPADLTGPKIDAGRIAQAPFLSLFGDHGAATELAAYAEKLGKLGGDAQHVTLPDIGIHGNSHLMMMERNNEEIADYIEKWISGHLSD